MPPKRTERKTVNKIKSGIENNEYRSVAQILLELRYSPENIKAIAADARFKPALMASINRDNPCIAEKALAEIMAIEEYFSASDSAKNAIASLKGSASPIKDIEDAGKILGNILSVLGFAPGSTDDKKLIDKILTLPGKVDRNKKVAKTASEPEELTPEEVEARKEKVFANLDKGEFSPGKIKELRAALTEATGVTGSDIAKKISTSNSQGAKRLETRINVFFSTAKTATNNPQILKEILKIITDGWELTKEQADKVMLIKAESLELQGRPVTEPEPGKSTRGHAWRGKAKKGKDDRSEGHAR